MTFRQIFVRIQNGSLFKDNNIGIQIRQYAWYPPEMFRAPVSNPKNQEKLSDEERREFEHALLRPAWSCENASVFQDPLLAKFTNYVMKGGRKEKARELLERTFRKIKMQQVRRYHLAKSDEERQSIKTNPLAVFHEAVENCRPLLHITHVKRGGITYKVPIAIPEHRSYFRSMQWLLEVARDEPRRTKENPEWCGEHMPDRLARELLNASNKTGIAFKKRVEYHKLAEANKAYAHYRWT